MPDKDNFGAIIQPTTVRSSSIGAFVQDDVGGTMRANGGDYHGGSESLVMWPAEVAAHAAVVNMQGSKSNACVSTDGTSFTLNAMHGHDVYAVAVAHASYSTGGTHGVNQHPEVSPAVKVGSGLGIPSPPAVAHSLRADGFDASEDGTGRGTPLVPQAMTVRRLTARECERLQAFPDDYTLIPWRKKQAEDCPDGPRYKALGNSMAVNCMAWIGERIAALENNR
jgi:site-specific DNA-cytosine methylase